MGLIFNIYKMKKYIIRYESGWSSHYGVCECQGTGTVSLSDEQAEIIRGLALEKDTQDVRQTGLKESHPEIYAILDEAYRDLALKTESEYWMWEGYRNGNYTCDFYELMEYCKEVLGFRFNAIDMNITDEDEAEEAEVEAFQDWLDDYVGGLETEECRRFFSEQMGIDVDCSLNEIEYEILVPEEIL